MRHEFSSRLRICLIKILCLKRCLNIFRHFPEFIGRVIIYDRKFGFLLSLLSWLWWLVRGKVIFRFIWGFGVLVVGWFFFYFQGVGFSLYWAYNLIWRNCKTTIYLSIFSYFNLFICLFICIYLCLTVSLSVCPSLCLSVFLSLCWSVCLSFCMSVCLSVFCLSVCLSPYLSACLSICFLSVFISVYLSVYLSVSLSACLSISISLTWGLLLTVKKMLWAPLPVAPFWSWRKLKLPVPPSGSGTMLKLAFKGLSVSTLKPVPLV